MLVITRKVGEAFTFTLPDKRQIEVRWLRHNGKQAKIGIDAPVDVDVARNELLN